MDNFTKEEIEKEIDRLVKRYSDLQKQYNGDSYYSKEIESKIDNLACKYFIEKLKTEAK